MSFELFFNISKDGNFLDICWWVRYYLKRKLSDPLSSSPYLILLKFILRYSVFCEYRVISHFFNVTRPISERATQSKIKYRHLSSWALRSVWKLTETKTYPAEQRTCGENQGIDIIAAVPTVDWLQSLKQFSSMCHVIYLKPVLLWWLCF